MFGPNLDRSSRFLPLSNISWDCSVNEYTGIGDAPMPLSCTIPGYNQQSRHYDERNAGAVGGDEPLACQQPFNTLPKLTTDAKQDLRPNLHLAVFHRGEIVRLIPI